MSGCFHPLTIRLSDGSPQVVRCGKCLDCLSHRQAGWISRLSQEFKASPDGVYFVTLTYNDESVPTVRLDGRDVPCISSPDIIKLNRDLRKRFQQGFFNDDTLRLVGWSDKDTRIPLPECHYKYYITSEYGPETKRPHYHGFFSRMPEDEALVFDLIDRVWGKGFVTVEKGKSEACAAYVTKYLVNDSLVPVDRRLPKPRAWMSKGLGETYLQNDKLLDWHRSAPLEHQYCLVNGKRAILPRYWRDRIFDDDMKAVILSDCVERSDRINSQEIVRRRSMSLRDLINLQNLADHHEVELRSQAEWRFRKNGKIK